MGKLNYHFLLLMIFLVESVFYSCQQEMSDPSVPEYTNSIITPQYLNLSGPMAQKRAEISGLTWYGDNLILLPQFPGRFRNKSNGYIYYIPKNILQACILAHKFLPLEPIPIPFLSGIIESQIEDFEGFEAIAFRGDTVFMTIESSPGDSMCGYLIRGEIKKDLSMIQLFPETLLKIPSKTRLKNMSEEAIIIAGGEVIVVHEANGLQVNRRAAAEAISIETNLHRQIPFPAIEYRITDFTIMDSSGFFWGINYFFPGDSLLFKPVIDPSMGNQKYPADYSQSVERILQFRFHHGQIQLTDLQPLHIGKSVDKDSRNWEGIVKFDDKGFIIVTDMYPKTILAYLPYNFK